MSIKLACLVTASTYIRTNMLNLSIELGTNRYAAYMIWTYHNILMIQDSGLVVNLSVSRCE
ncbi:MAG TPA: hypothetical protein VJP58_06570 [Candidatus Nitrosocosmicus sp.]|nr:hypothetical protein [Candidatus Nitrosocosmicus sp.]